MGIVPCLPLKFVSHTLWCYRLVMVLHGSTLLCCRGYRTHVQKSFFDEIQFINSIALHCRFARGQRRVSFLSSWLTRETNASFYRELETLVLWFALPAISFSSPQAIYASRSDVRHGPLASTRADQDPVGDD